MVNENPRKRLAPIRLAGTNWRNGRRRDGARPLCRLSFSALAALFFLLAMVPAHLACQMSDRPPMVLGRASVTLIATLESLSVGVAPMAPAVPVPGHDSVPDAGSVAITTSWAVPANLTTIRMICIASDGSANAIDVYAQRAGESNRAFTRTDYLHVENRTPVAPAQHTNPSTGSLNVVVQAL
jgi:hypothetical protein